MRVNDRKGSLLLNGASVLLLGVGFGLRHALDVDHVVVVSTLLQRDRSAWRAACIAASWGAGHTAAFLGLGLLIVQLGVQLPESFEPIAQLLVAIMLVYLGLRQVLQAGVRQERDAPAPTPLRPAAAVARPLLVGVVHGFAGSAGIALVAASTMSSPLLASLYLGVFCLGTIVGMVLLTVLLSRALAWAEHRRGQLGGTVASAGAWLSIALGVTILVSVAIGGSS
ncbi:MAG: hypothetical protein RL685_908 [Pseudomonadota bacterium]|jgi:cytochrome c biogenesis protein CcdA